MGCEELEARLVALESLVACIAAEMRGNGGFDVIPYLRQMQQWSEAKASEDGQVAARFLALARRFADLADRVDEMDV